MHPTSLPRFGPFILRPLCLSTLVPLHASFKPQRPAQFAPRRLVPASSSASYRSAPCASPPASTASPPRRRRRVVIRHHHPPTSAIRVHAPVAQPLFTLVQRGKPLGVVSGPSRAAVSSSARRPRPRDAERPPQGLPPRGGGGDGLGGALSWHGSGRAFTSTGAIFLDLDGGGGDEGGGS